MPYCGKKIRFCWGRDGATNRFPGIIWDLSGSCVGTRRRMARGGRGVHCEFFFYKVVPQTVWPHWFSTTLFLSYGPSLAMFTFLLWSCISTNASMRLFNYCLNVLTSCLFPSFWWSAATISIVIIAFSSTYNVFFAYQVDSIYTYTWVTCSSALSFLWEDPSSPV